MRAWRLCTRSIIRETSRLSFAWVSVSRRPKVNLPPSTRRRGRHAVVALLTVLAFLVAACGGPSPSPSPSRSTAGEYPWHTGIVATTFWVGEIFDPKAADGSQVMSTYDSEWMKNYGGCDGVDKGGCQTEPRTQAKGF